MICHSVTIVRGCSGNCSFCAITRHQGAAVTSRSSSSVLEEIAKITQMKDFKGTITDLGGPTANLFATSCLLKNCTKRDCLYPSVCKHLHIDEQKMIDLLNAAVSLEGVKHLFISSGLRMELLMKTPELFKKIASDHTPGVMKIAPEHTDDALLALMHKEPHSVLKKFVKECEQIEKSTGKRFHSHHIL